MSSSPVPYTLAPLGASRRAARSAVREAAALLPLLVLYLAVCALTQPGPHPVRDEPDLLVAARHLADGHLVPPVPFGTPRAYLWHGPGLPFVLAPLVTLHLPLTAIRFIEPVLLGAAVLLFHRLLRQRLPARAALTWTYALGLYFPLLSVVPAIHKEPLSILLVVAGMLALTHGMRPGAAMAKAPATPLVLAGLALAALAMVRLEYGWVALGLLAVAALTAVVRRHGRVARRSAVVAAVAVAACLPWLSFTYHQTGKVLYWGTASGLSLFWMSPTLPGETGQWHGPRAVMRDPALAAYRPLFRELRALDPVAADARLKALAIRHIRARPLAYARNLAANASRLAFSVPMRPGITPVGVALYVAFNTLLLGGAAWAAAVLWRRRAQAPPETAPIAAFAIVAVLVHLPPSAGPRMLLPIAPALVWLMAQAAVARRALRGS
jgi:hypothetical protein